jgi:predicted permease
MLQFLRRLAALFRRDRLDNDLFEEISLHIELRRQALIDQGVDARAAETQARGAFGSVAAVREETRAVWGFPLLETIVQDVRYAARLLRRSPTFTAVATLSLAVGVGSAAAVFGLADAVLFRKLPVDHPDELTILQWRARGRMPAPSLTGNWSEDASGQYSTSFAWPTFDALRKGAPPNVRVFGFAGYMSLNLTIDGTPETGEGQAVSGNYFDALGIAPAVGRLLVEADDRPDAPPVVVISDDFWQRRFGRAADVVGRPMSINAIPVTIIGVTPKRFRGTLEVDDAPVVAVPLAFRATLERDASYRTADQWWVLMMARVTHPATVDGVRPVLETVLRTSVATANPALSESDLPSLELLPGAHGQIDVRNGMREPLQIMAAIVAIVVLVACAIIANLLLARGEARRREITVRAAIGASRGRVVRQLLTEGLLLAALGSGIGLLFARWIANKLTPALGGPGLSSMLEIATNWRVVVFIAGLAATCTVLFALAPALRSTDVRLGRASQEQLRIGGTGRRRSALSRSLVTVQVALSLLLLTSAALLVRSLSLLQAVQPGFDSTRLLVFRVDPTRNGSALARVRALYGDALTRLRAIPGVQSASLSNNTLIAGGGSMTVAALPHEPPLDRGTPAAREFFRTHGTYLLRVDETFFTTMRIPILRGRALASSDTAESRPVAVVNSALARQLFGEIDVVGRTFKTDLQPNATRYEIVGVCADAKYTSLRRGAPPTAYFTFRQQPIGPATFALKTAGDPSELVRAVREAMRELDPHLPLLMIRSQEEQIRQSLRREVLFSRLAMMLGSVTVVLAAIGLYGLLTYTVARRTPEIGIRMALGAERGAVRWIVMRDALILVGAGVMLGIPAALAGTRVLKSVLFELTSTDPISFVLASVTIVGVGMLSAYLPARRASRVDPIVALRAD